MQFLHQTSFFHPDISSVNEMQLLNRIVLIFVISPNLVLTNSSFTFLPTKDEFNRLFSPIWNHLVEHNELESFGLTLKANFSAIKGFLLEKYKTHYSSPCECGRRNDNSQPGKIVRGIEAKPNEFPWQALILFRNRFSCGGTLLSKRWILTAEHCFRNSITNGRFSHKLFQVILGEHNLTFIEGPEKRFNIKRIVPHPNYFLLGGNPQFDFSLVELTVDIRFTREISPVCLPGLNSELFAGSTAIASGFGELEFQGKTPKALNYAKMKVLGNSDCGNNSNILEHHLCASGRHGHRGIVVVQWTPLIVATSGPALSGHNNRWLLYPAVFQF